MKLSLATCVHVTRGLCIMQMHNLSLSGGLWPPKHAREGAMPAINVVFNVTLVPSLSLEIHASRWNV